MTKNKNHWTAVSPEWHSTVHYTRSTESERRYEPFK